MSRPVRKVRADGARIRALLEAAGPGPLPERIDRLSGELVGRPYVVDPLGGGPRQREVFRATVDGFDCVTYVETVLALARARSVSGFALELRRLRYRRGRPGWRARNHYMTCWARENAAGRRVRDITVGAGTVVRRRVLSVVAGLPALEARFRCVPRSHLARWMPRLATGDVVLFASTRRHLDVFHAGILVRRGGEIRLRHARRSRGKVVEERLSDFLAGQRTSGIVVLRPMDSRRPRPS